MRAASNDKTASVSRCSLRISDKDMQAEFLIYIRNETFKSGCFVLIFLTVINIALLGSYVNRKDNERDEGGETDQVLVSEIIFAMCVPADILLCMTIIIACRNKKYVELIGLTIYVPFLLVIYGSYLFKTDELDSQARNAIGFIVFISYGIMGVLLSTDLPTSMAQRLTFAFASFSIILIKR